MAKTQAKSALIDEFHDDDPDLGVQEEEGAPPPSPIKTDYPFWWKLFFRPPAGLDKERLKLLKGLKEMRVSSKDAPGPGDAKRFYQKRRASHLSMTQLKELGLTAVALQASEETIKKFPHGFLVKHPAFGSLRVRSDEAVSEEEAKKVFAERKCPNMSVEQLEKTGMRIGVLRFVPADTEIGK